MPLFLLCSIQCFLLHKGFSYTEIKTMSMVEEISEETPRFNDEKVRRQSLKLSDFLEPLD